MKKRGTGHQNYFKKRFVSQSLEELLVAVVALMLLEPEVAILVGLEVGLGPEAPPAQVANMRFLLGVHAHVGLQRASCNQKPNFFCPWFIQKERIYRLQRNTLCGTVAGTSGSEIVFTSLSFFLNQSKI
jgi:hypothetical protein